MSDCINGAVFAIVGELQDKGKITTASTTPGHVSTGVSAGKCIELQRKSYLQSLLDDGILSEAEYAEQERDIWIVQKYTLHGQKLSLPP